MNRQSLKYRAWDKDMREFRELLCIDCNKDGPISCVFKGSQDGHNFKKAIVAFDGTTVIVIEQTIGINDINDKDIYDGDVVLTAHGNIRIIQWDRGAFHARVPNYTKGKPSVPVNFWTIQPQSHWPRVIGNIHENPEMLEPGYEYAVIDKREHPCSQCETGEMVTKGYTQPNGQQNYECTVCGHEESFP